MTTQAGGVEVLLEGKNAVIYGGCGSIGGAVARASAREGARVFLADRTLAKLEHGAGRRGDPFRGGTAATVNISYGALID